MPVSAGTHLGPYEILAPLGADGMGEVWRAIEVALRILPALRRAQGVAICFVKVQSPVLHLAAAVNQGEVSVREGVDILQELRNEKVPVIKLRVRGPGGASVFV
jgi:hypothetical protein